MANHTMHNLSTSPIQPELSPRGGSSESASRGFRASNQAQSSGYKQDTHVKPRVHDHVAEDPFSQMVAQFCFASGISELQSQGDVWSQRMETKKQAIEAAQTKLGKLEGRLAESRFKCSMLPSEVTEVHGYEKKLKTLENRRSRRCEDLASLNNAIALERGDIDEMRRSKVQLRKLAQKLKRDCQANYNDEMDMSEKAAQLQSENEGKRAVIMRIKKAIHEEKVTHASEMSVLQQIVTSNSKTQDQMVAALLKDHNENKGKQVGNMSVIEEAATRKKMIASSWKIAKQKHELNYTSIRLNELKTAFDQIKVETGLGPEDAAWAYKKKEERNMQVYKEVAEFHGLLNATNVKLARAMEDLESYTSERLNADSENAAATKSKRLDTIETKIASGEDTLKVLNERKEAIEGTVEMVTPLLHQLLRILLGNNGAQAQAASSLAAGQKPKFDITALQSLGLIELQLSELLIVLNSVPGGNALLYEDPVKKALAGGLQVTTTGGNTTDSAGNLVPHNNLRSPSKDTHVVVHPPTIESIGRSVDTETMEHRPYWAKELRNISKNERAASLSPENESTVGTPAGPPALES